MTDTRVLLTYHDLKVEVESTPNRELIDHLHNTILGQPGSIRYQHTDLVDRLNSPGENYFMYLRKSGRMLGSVGFVGRHGTTNGMEHDSWMIRYFSIKAPMGSAPRKRKEKKEVREEDKRSSVLGRFIQPVFANPSQLRGPDTGESNPTLIYALIEQKNLRSMNFSTQMGLETVGIVQNFTFSRMRPRRSGSLEPLPGGEKEEMIKLLNHFYRDYTLFFTDPLFKNDHYFVIRRNGRIVAGVQAYRVVWRIVDFGNGSTNRVMSLLARIPWVRKRFDPGQLRLIAFDGIYCEPGQEDALYELLEGVLERMEAYLGMMMMDESSTLYRIFRENGRLGFLHRLIGSFTADIRMRFLHMPDSLRDYFMEHPTYIPTYDNS